MKTGIGYNLGFEQMDAFVAAGATIDELDGLDKGRWDKKLVAKVVAWHRSSRLIKNNVEDVVQRASKRKR